MQEASNWAVTCQTSHWKIVYTLVLSSQLDRFTMTDRIIKIFFLTSRQVMQEASNWAVDCQNSTRKIVDTLVLFTELDRFTMTAGERVVVLSLFTPFKK